MEQQHKKPAASTAASSPASSGSSSSSSRSIQGSMSSAFLGVRSSSTHSQSQLRRSSPSLYPPPAALPGILASPGSASASSGSASGSSSSSQFHQISTSPGAAAKRRPRPNSLLTHSLPSPFLSELSSIRRMGNNVFGGNDAAQEIMTQRPLLHGHGQQEQEMTRSSSSSLAIPQSHHRTPIIPPSGELSGLPSASPLTMRGLHGFAPPPLQQQRAQRSSFSSLQPLPTGGNFSGFPLPASSQPQQMQPSSSTDLPSRIFSGIEPPPAAASQNFSSYLEPLPSGSTIFQSSSSCSVNHAQPSLSDSELPPLPPSLEIPHYGLPPFGQLSPDNGSSTVEQSSRSGFVQPSETYELAPLPESLQMPPLLLQQVKQEPVVFAPRLEPEIISLDDGDDDELSAFVHSFASSHAHGSASHPNPMREQPSNFDLEGMQHRLQLGGSGTELSMRGAAGGVGVGQTWKAMATPESVHEMVNNGGSSSSSIPWNGHGSMPMYSRSRSEEQALQQLSNLVSQWSSTASSSSGQSMSSSIAGSSQGWAAVPALANKFDMMSIGGSSSNCSSKQQMPWNYSSLYVQNSTPVPAVPKLILGGMNRPGLPPRPPAHGAGASSSMSRRGSTSKGFSEADMETINKDNRLKELVNTHPKRVKKILRNREYAARVKARKANDMQDLQYRVDALKIECTSLSTQVQSHQEMLDNLKTKNREVQIKLQGLNEQARLKQALNDQLQSEIQSLKLLELNMLCANGIHNPKSSQMAGWSASSANGLHQPMDSHANDLISSQQLQMTQEHTPQLQPEQQPDQTVDDELMDQQHQP